MVVNATAERYPRPGKCAILLKHDDIYTATICRKGHQSATYWGGIALSNKIMGDFVPLFLAFTPREMSVSGLALHPSVVKH